MRLWIATNTFKVPVQCALLVLVTNSYTFEIISATNLVLKTLFEYTNWSNRNYIFSTNLEVNNLFIFNFQWNNKNWTFFVVVNFTLLYFPSNFLDFFVRSSIWWVFSQWKFIQNAINGMYISKWTAFLR